MNWLIESISTFLAAVDEFCDPLPDDLIAAVEVLLIAVPETPEAAGFSDCVPHCVAISASIPIAAAVPATR